MLGPLPSAAAEYPPALALPLCGDRRCSAAIIAACSAAISGRQRLLVLVQLLDLVAVFDRVSISFDGVKVGVTHRGKLDRRQVEVD
jgi:hypothetical protein